MEKIAQDLVFRRVMVLHDLEILVGERKSPFEWEKGFSQSIKTIKQKNKKEKNDRIVGQKKQFVYVFGHKTKDC